MCVWLGEGRGCVGESCFQNSWSRHLFFLGSVEQPPRTQKPPETMKRGKKPFVENTEPSPRLFPRHR